VNKAQKILTAAFLILFAVSLICFPWISYHRDSHLLGPILTEPKNLGIDPVQWANYSSFYRDWTRAAIIWAWIAVVYVGLMFILAPTRK
jgi:hypothetical protein